MLDAAMIRNQHLKKSHLPRARASPRRPDRRQRRIDPRYAPFRLRLGPSPIHGFGVFACEPIPPNRRVLEYTGERISRAEAHRRFIRTLQRKGPLCLRELDSYWYLDGEAGGSGAEYINHACDPNLRTQHFAGHVWHLSRRAIRPGEELTVDYKFSKKTVRVPCRCGFARCRGTLNVK